MAEIADRLLTKLGEAIDVLDATDVKALKELTATFHELCRIRGVKDEAAEETAQTGILILPPQEIAEEDG